MRSRRVFLLLSALSTQLGFAEAAPIDFRAQVRPILEARCFKCHGEEKQKGKLRLDELSPDFATDRPAAERWHDVRDALNLGEMPPEEEPELPGNDRRILVEWIEQELEALREATRNTDGRIVLRRLNRVEYQNTMEDLLGIVTDYARNLPPEGLSEDGFRNNGSALQMSDLQLEYYLEAARAGLRKAIVTGPKPEVVHHTITKTVKDKGRGSSTLDDNEQFVAKLKDYPASGEFLIRVKARARLASGRGFPQLRAAIGYRADVRAPRVFMDPIDVTSEEWQTYEFRDRIEHFPLPSKTQSKFPGLLVWLDNAYGEGRNKPLKPKKKKNNNKRKKKEEPAPSEVPYPSIEIEEMEFIGPAFETWPPKHHTRILFPSEHQDEEVAHANAVINRFVSRAFRRPAEKGDLVPYRKFFAAARNRGSSFEGALRETLAMVLISPEFLYLVEPSDSTKRTVNDWELASRLSYFLWSTMPDKRLFQLARKGTLHQPDILREEVARMIADPRAWQFVKQFTEQWLDVGAVDRVAVNPEYYPDFNNDLKQSMRGETLHFFAEILRKNLSALNFLDSEFVMVDEALANHYGLQGPRGSSFMRVALNPQDRRGGLLAHGSVLLGNSTGEDSHPVKRAVWIRERLLDDPPSDPPPNVPNLDATNPDFAQLPVREQLRLHRNEASCNDCHRGIDPWGIVLENYGGDGLWRDKILRPKAKGRGLEGKPVVSETALPDGTKVASLDELKKYLLADRRKQFARAFVSKLLTYALGRSLELTDEKTVDELTAKFIAGDYRIAPLIQLVVSNELFQSK